MLKSIAPLLKNLGSLRLYLTSPPSSDYWFNHLINKVPKDQKKHSAWRYAVAAPAFIYLGKLLGVVRSDFDVSVMLTAEGLKYIENIKQVETQDEE